MLDCLGKVIVMLVELEILEIICCCLFEWDKEVVIIEGKIMLFRDVIVICNEYVEWVIYYC